MSDLKDVTLDTVAKGAAAEVFAHEFKRVLENIQDPNTDPEEKRKLTLTFTFEPLRSREEAHVSLAVKSKLAGMAPVGSHMFMGRRDGRLRATTHDVQQDGLFDDETGEVVDLESRRQSS